MCCLQNTHKSNEVITPEKCYLLTATFSRLFSFFFFGELFISSVIAILLLLGKVWPKIKVFLYIF